MSKLNNFRNFVTESDDHSELKAMGFKSDLPFDDRISEAIDAWYSDTEVQNAMQVLRTRAEDLMAKNDIDPENDPEDEIEWQQRMDWVYENSIDDIGWFEFVTIVAQ